MTNPHICCNPSFSSKEKLAGAPTEGNSTPAVSHALTSAPTQAFAFAPTFAPGLLERYIDKNL